MADATHAEPRLTALPDGPWAASLPAGAIDAVACLRQRPGLLAARDRDGTLWLRGDHVDGALRTAIALLAPAALYTLAADGTLTHVGDLLPAGHVPELAWMPIARFIDVGMPPSRLAGVIERRAALSLVPSDRPRPANGLLGSLPALAAWAEDAPAFRFAPLRYAVSGDRAFVLGKPTPSIAGVRLYESNGICVPCGYELSPAIDAASLRSILRLDAGDVALFETAGCSRVPADAFVPMTRASIRLTSARQIGGGR